MQQQQINDFLQADDVASIERINIDVRYGYAFWIKHNSETVHPEAEQRDRWGIRGRVQAASRCAVLADTDRDDTRGRLFECLAVSR